MLERFVTLSLSRLRRESRNNITHVTNLSTFCNVLSLTFCNTNVL